MHATIAFGSGGKATEKHDTSQRLFDINDVPRAEPHQQTQQQFAADPRTWWHGRMQHPALHGLNWSYEDSKRAGISAGLHIGSRQSAEDRLATHGEPREVPHPHSGEEHATAKARMFPLRAVGKTHNTPVRAAGDEWDDWKPLEDDKGEYYRNEVEDQGSISMRVPGLHHVMSHRQFVAKAIKGGKNVHPIIEAEAAQHPDYSETFVNHREQEANERKAAMSWGSGRMFSPNDVQSPGSGEIRRRQLENEHQDEVLRRKDPGLHSALHDFGKALG
jgi:hypothetical protein